MPGFVFCSLEGRGCEKVGVRGEIIEDKQGKTWGDFEFWAFLMRFWWEDGKYKNNLQIVCVLCAYIAVA